LAVNSRLSSKEAQGSLMKEMITEARINEEEAGTIISEHLDAIATIEKIHDDEKSRQVMALEMRLEERKALAQRMVRFL
jgi:riboflavin synthase alpha subunit